MSRGPDAATLLERALIRAAACSDLALTVEATDWTRWASATFTGARHDLVVSAPSSAATSAWLDRLGEHEFRLPGHLVAELAIVRSHRADDRTTATIEVLTVESR
ncbi:hypothetical protein [Sphingomonas turrisvirgatae]|uniref:Uncharacterized protein n=1 Tax=Sphingomonas turrisvirgatae TaxID=1888892 RepID=A0A1E3LSG9_9SPHN|nr:hypothetical protein [Sphingomonas turrisvirgatae]ODP36698.1 hypothetical protein BFL28_05190 [Sphingomonas turrisvirgatae]